MAIRIETLAGLEFEDLESLYQVDMLVAHNSLMIIYGGDGQGKTTAVHGFIAKAITTGYFFGRKSKIRKVLYVSGEGNTFLPYKLRSLAKVYGDFSLLGGTIDIIRDNDSDVVLYDKSCMVKLIENIRLSTELSSNYDLIIFDTLNSMATGYNESSASDTAYLKANLKLVANTLDCSVLVVHHSTKLKDGVEGDEAKDIRGSSAITGMCDNVWLVHNRHVYCRKTRNGQDFNPIAFSINDIDGVGIATFADNATSMKPSIETMLIQELKANPKVSNLELIRLVFNPNAQRTTSKQLELLVSARLKFQELYPDLISNVVLEILPDKWQGITANELDQMKMETPSQVMEIEAKAKVKRKQSIVSSEVHIKPDTSNGFITIAKSLLETLE